MNMSRRWVAAVGIGGVSIGLLKSVSAAVEETPGDAVEAFRKAMIGNNRDAFEALCAAQLSYGHSGGKVQTKAEFIADATSQKSKWKTLEFDDVRNTVAGANAISRFRLKGETESDGKVTAVDIGVMMVWQKQDNGWRLLARQAYKV